MQLFTVYKFEKSILPRLATDENICSNVKIVKKVQFLVHECNTGIHRPGDRQTGVLFTVDFNGAPIR